MASGNERGQVWTLPLRMLPRCTRAGLIARRQFHTSLQSARQKANIVAKAPIRAVVSQSKPITKTPSPKPAQKNEETAEQVARNALSYFFLSGRPLAKGKAAQARQYGTLAFYNRAVFATGDGEKRDLASESRQKQSEDPEIRAKEEAKQSDRKEKATDKASEEPKDDKEVCWNLIE